MGEYAADNMPMPKYKSHKEVWALQIKEIEFVEDGYKSFSPQNAFVNGYTLIE